MLPALVDSLNTASAGYSDRGDHAHPRSDNNQLFPSIGGQAKSLEAAAEGKKEMESRLEEHTLGRTGADRVVNATLEILKGVGNYKQLVQSEGSSDDHQGILSAVNQFENALLLTLKVKDARFTRQENILMKRSKMEQHEGSQRSGAGYDPGQLNQQSLERGHDPGQLNQQSRGSHDPDQLNQQSGAGYSAGPLNQQSGAGYSAGPLNQQSGAGYSSGHWNQQSGPGYSASPLNQQSGVGYSAGPLNQQSGPGYSASPLNQQSWAGYSAGPFNQQSGAGYSADPLNQQSRAGYSAGPLNQQSGPGYSAGPLNQQSGPGYSASPLNQQSGAGYSAGPLNQQSGAGYSAGPLNQQSRAGYRAGPLNQQSGAGYSAGPLNQQSGADYSAGPFNQQSGAGYSATDSIIPSQQTAATHAPADTDEDVLLLIGRSGNGKSATGNTILGAPTFEKRVASQARVPTIGQGRREIGGKMVTVKDGPGINYPDNATPEQLKKVVEDVEKSLKLSSYGFTALLLPFEFGGRFTQQEIDTIRVIRSVLGDKVIEKYGVCVITHGDDFEYEAEEAQGDEHTLTFEGWLDTQTGHMKELLLECKHRCVLFNNATKDKAKKQNQVAKLMSVVPRQARYTKEEYEEAEKGRQALALVAQLPELMKKVKDHAETIGQKINQYEQNREYDIETYKTGMENLVDQLGQLETMLQEDGPKCTEVDGMSLQLRNLKFDIITKINTREIQNEIKKAKIKKGKFLQRSVTLGH
jgi:soluble cytochrome b562